MRKSLLVVFLSLTLLFLICIGISFFSIFYSVNIDFIPGFDKNLPGFSGFFEAFIKYLPISFLLFFPVFFILSCIYKPPFWGIIIPLLIVSLLFFILLIPFSFSFNFDKSNYFKENSLNSINLQTSQIIQNQFTSLYAGSIADGCINNAIIAKSDQEPPVTNYDSLPLSVLSEHKLSKSDFKLLNNANFNIQKMTFFTKLQNNFFKLLIHLSMILQTSFTRGIVSYILFSACIFLVLSSLWPFAFFSSWKLLDLLFISFGFITLIHALNFAFSSDFINYFSSKIPTVIPEIPTIIFVSLIFIFLQITGFFVIKTHKKRMEVNHNEE